MAKQSGKHRGSGRLAVVVLCIGCVLLLALFFFLHSRYIFAGGQLVRRDAQTLDASQTDVGVEQLLRLESPRSLDLRGSRLSTEDYERLRQAFPDCDIRWSVPFSASPVDCQVNVLVLAALEESDLPLFDYLPVVRSVDVTAVENWPAVLALHQAHPEYELTWDVPLGTANVSYRSTALEPDSSVSAQELLDKLVCFDALTQVDARACSLTPEEQLTLAQTYPHVAWLWDVTLAGKTMASTVETLDLSGRTDLDLEEIVSRAPFFSALKTLDMTGCGFDNDEMLRVVEAYPDTDVVWTFTLHGVEICSTDTEVDFSNIPIEDTAEIEAMLPCMKKLEKVVMCDCGIGDEEMDALNKRHENVRFVWMIHFGTYYLRTDATSFIASLFNGSEANYCNLYDKDVEPLKYCTDMVALDLGHMSFTKCEFLRSMPKLRFLIMAECAVDDISPIADLQELFFCELFLCPVKDFSPLLECKELRHLNICHCFPEDLDVIKQLTWLERLWFMSAALSYQDIIDLRETLTDTELQLGVQGTATGGTWRYHDAYYEMRDTLGVYYMAGGTEAPK